MTLSDLKETKFSSSANNKYLIFAMEPNRRMFYSVNQQQVVESRKRGLSIKSTMTS